MQDCIDPNSFKGNTSGYISFMSYWEEFLMHYRITDLRIGLKIYQLPNYLIPDLLN